MSSNSLNQLSKSSLMLPSLLPESKPGFKLGSNYSLPIYALCQLSERGGSRQVAMGGGGGASRTGITNGWTLFDPFSLDASKESDWRATSDAVLSMDCDEEARYLLAAVGPFACVYKRPSEQGDDEGWKSVGSEWQAEAHPDGYIQKVKMVAPKRPDSDWLLLTMSTHAGLQCWSFDLKRGRISSRPLWTLKEGEAEWKDFDILEQDLYLVSPSTLHLYRLAEKASTEPRLSQKLSLVSSGESEKSAPEWSARCLLVGQLASYSRLFIAMNRNPLRKRQGRSASYLYMYERSASEQYTFRKSFYLYEKSIVSAKLHPMGHLLAFGSNDGTLLVYEVQKKATLVKCLRKRTALHSLAITALEFQNNEALDLVRVISASPDTRVLFTDLQGLELGKSRSVSVRNMLWFMLWTLLVLLLAILYNSYNLQQQHHE